MGLSNTELKSPLYSKKASLMENSLSTLFTKSYNLQKKHGELLKKCFIRFGKAKYFSILIATRPSTIDTGTQLSTAILSMFNPLWYCVSLYGLLGFLDLWNS